jgi:hypothetical protein
MVTLQSPDGRRVCTRCDSTGALSGKDIAAMGYSGWTVVSESAAVPVEQLSADEIEAARLNGLTRFQLMQEIKALIAAKPNG